jgi:hypothetical protein
MKVLQLIILILNSRVYSILYFFSSLISIVKVARELFLEWRVSLRKHETHDGFSRNLETLLFLMMFIDIVLVLFFHLQG